MIELLLGLDPAPAAFAVGTRYVLGFAVDGQVPSKALWSLGRRTEPKSTGIDKVIFTPAAAEPYYLHVQADGQEEIFILSATVAGASADKVVIAWSEPAPRSKQAFSATISATRKPRSIGWSLLYNNVPVQSGTGAAVTVSPVNPGIYRLVATILDSQGNTVIAENAVVVPFPYGLQSVVTPQQPADTTLYHIGDVYSPLIEGGETECSYLPYELVNLSTVVKLVPGTTHFKAELDPVFSDVDDEVIVRTAHGNWTLQGPPGGLSTESMPYDYRHGQPVQPAALDLSVRYALEAVNVHGQVARAFKFRVVFRCYRAGTAIFRYSPCDWSAYYGGSGERQRRLIALVTNVEAILDAEWADNRLGSRNQEPFAATNQKRIVGQFNVTGNPDRPLYAEDHFYTAQNAIAHYESPEGRLRDLIVSCTYGLAGVRPCYLDFSQPALPRIVQRIKQLSGKLVVYVAGGALVKDTYVHVRIYTGKSPGYATVSVPIRESVYNPNFGEYAKAGEADIGILDFEFDRVGVLMDLRVDESVVAAGTAPYEPMHQVAEDAFFASINSPAIQVDTACFHDPVAVPIFEGTFAGSAVALPDCSRLACGPVGIYCYTTASGTVPPDPNTPPVADPQSLTTPQDTALDITLTATDAETPGALAYSVTVAPLFGAINGNPSPPDIRYTPDPGFYGLDDFAFTVTDPGGLTDSAVVNITVTQAIPPNTPPTAIDRNLTMLQDTSLPITLTGYDAETPLSLAFAVTIGPLHGGVTGLAPNVIYTPTAGYSGPDSFTFSVTDPGALSDTGIVSITVTPVAPANLPPTADPQSLSMDQDTTLPITLTGTDPELAALNYAVVAGPFHGHLGGSAPNVTYTPDPGYVGSDSFTFSVTDPGALSDTAVIAITVNHVNHAPSATPQTLSLDQDTVLNITLAGTDPDGDSLTAFTITTLPAHGTLGGAGASITYTPDAGYTGPDSFQFTVTDNGAPPLTSTAATVSLTVNSTSPVFYMLIGSHNPDSVCNSFVPATPAPHVNNIYSLDGDPVLYELVSSAPLPVVVPPQTNNETGPMVFMVKIDQRLIDTNTASPGNDVVNKIAFTMSYDRWTNSEDEDPQNCTHDPTGRYDFAVSILNVIATAKSQQDNVTHEGTWADPFRLTENPS